MSIRKAFWTSLLGVSLAVTWDFYRQDERAHRRIIMPLVHKAFGGEGAHRVAVWAAKMKIFPQSTHVVQPSISDITLWDLKFPNPVGLAAGFDKDGECIEGMARCGFGFIEIGSVTPLAQLGNEKPRVFRLNEDNAIINRYGFNSIGHDAVALNLRLYRTQDAINTKTMLGVNLGKNKESTNPVNDYVSGVYKFAKYADYLVINVSSPNTPGLRDLQGKKELESLVDAVISARDTVCGIHVESSSKNSSKGDEKQKQHRKVPILVKIAPDLSEKDKKEIAEVVLSHNVDGLIISNTTTARPETLKNESKIETGGLSGTPVRDISTRVISDMYLLTKGKVPIIGVGGISCGHDAMEKIKVGASAVQVYTALSYQGPPVVKRVQRELEEIIQAEGFKHVSQAIGSNHNICAK